MSKNINGNVISYMSCTAFMVPVVHRRNVYKGISNKCPICRLFGLVYIVFYQFFKFFFTW